MDTTQRANLRRLGWVTLIASSAIGLLSLAGWLASKPEWVAPIPGLMPMHPRSALLLVMSSSSLALLMQREPSRVGTVIARVLGWTVLVMAVSSLLRRMQVIEWTIGGNLFEHLGASRGTAPTGAVICYLLIGAGLLLINHRPRRIRTAQVLALAAVAIASVALAGYAYDAALLAGPGAVGPTSGMTFYTSIAVGLLSVSLLCARAQYGLMAIISSRRSGGTFARRMLAGVLVIPVLASGIVIAERGKLLDQQLGQSVLAVVAMVLLVAIIVLVARSMNRIDADRARALERSRKAYEREWLQRTWFELVLEQIPDGIILIDQRGRISSINRAARALSCGPTGKLDEYGNEVIFDIRDEHGKPLAARDLPPFRALRESADLKAVEIQVKVKDGRLVPVLVSSVRVWRPDGKVGGVVTVAQDVTARKELDRLREEWSSLVAHDLRQPATVIAFASQLLPRLHQGELNTGETRALERIQTASHRLKRMIEDLLDFSRIEAQRLSIDRQPVDMCAITRAMVERIGELTGAKLRLDCDKEGFISGDLVRVEQVLGNLLSNAIKYGEQGSEIVVEVRHREDAVHLSVTNRGAGISKEDIPKLFSRFSRTASSGQIEGLGLGLYISKGIVEAHGGRIWAESTPGEFTTFHVLFPSLQATTQAEGEPAHVQ